MLESAFCKWINQLLLVRASTFGAAGSPATRTQQGSIAVGVVEHAHCHQDIRIVVERGFDLAFLEVVARHDFLLQQILDFWFEAGQVIAFVGAYLAAHSFQLGFHVVVMLLFLHFFSEVSQ